MKKLKIGVVGIGRGRNMYEFCMSDSHAELVAVCDKWEDGLREAREIIGRDSVSYYTDYDEFLKQDMDVVMLANYATEHAPFAIRAMEAGKDVISEVLPAQTLSEAVRLIETVERTGRKYCYAENFCYMGGPREMKRRYLCGDLGTFEYGEGEYIHNCESIWDRITFGDKTHWRNRMSAFFYCTHSAGPLIHITGKRPVKVTGFELPFNARMERMGAMAGFAAVEMVSFEDGSMFKSCHGVGPSKNSDWYIVYGSKGTLETARETVNPKESTNRVYVNLDKVEGVFGAENQIHEDYIPTDELTEEAAKRGHGGSDYYCLMNAVRYLSGEPADIIDVYEAIDMWLVGFFGYESALNGNVPMEIPDFRDKAVRDRYRNDNRCTDPAVAGDQLQPSYSKGNPVIPDSTYELWQKRWQERRQREREEAAKKKAAGQK